MVKLTYDVHVVNIKNHVITVTKSSSNDVIFKKIAKILNNLTKDKVLVSTGF